MGDEIERDAAAERHRRHELEGVAHVGERLLHPDCEEDDPSDHREVEIAVRVSRHRQLRLARRLLQLALRDDRDDVEIRPPESAGDREPEEHGCEDAEPELGLGGAYPERDDRLAERDNQDEGVALREVAGRESPACLLYTSPSPRDS